MRKMENSKVMTKGNSIVDSDCFDGTPIDGDAKLRIGIADGQKLVIDNYFNSGFDDEISVMFGIEK